MRNFAFGLSFGVALACAGWNALAVPMTTRLTPLTMAEQQKSRKLIDEIYQKPLAQAKDDQARAQIGRQILQAGIDTKNDSVGRFALLVCALETARDAGDLNTALSAIDALQETWDVDGLRMRADLLLKLQKLLRRPEDLGALERAAGTVVETALNEDQYPLAHLLSELAVNSARRSGDLSLIKLATERNAEVEEIESANITDNNAVAALKVQADDANLSLGKFEAFVRGDWTLGLPRLALGSDPQLKSIALMELAKPANAAACLSLADGWWDRSASEKGLARKHILTHAALWYSQAEPGLNGLSRAKAQKRAREAPESAPVLTLGPGHGPDHGKGGIALVNQTNAREGLDVLRSVLARYPEQLKDVAQMELVKYHDATEFQRHAGDAQKMDGSYSQTPVVGSINFIMLWGIYEEWKPGKYLIVYRVQATSNVEGDNICFLDVCANGNTIAQSRPSAAEFTPGQWSNIPILLNLSDNTTIEYRLWPNNSTMALDRVYIFRIP